MNRSKWMLVLLAGGLAGVMYASAQTGGGTTPSSTAVTYDSSMPDTPFVGAWDGEKPDCSDPEEEKECWKCEKSASGNSAFPVPKYWYEPINTCPQLKIKEKTHDECVCELVGKTKRVEVQATADTTDGKWWYVPKGKSGCGKDGPENSVKFKEIRWVWRTYGRPGGDIAKRGDIASFDYNVPNGDVKISVVFQARGKPDYPQCGVVNAGPTVVGTIEGVGYRKQIIQPISRTYPAPIFVTDYPMNSNGDKGWGLLDPRITHNIGCKSVCSTADCEKFRMEGQFFFNATMQVLSCVPVTADNCALPKGDCNNLSQMEIDETIFHEQKHYDLWREFIDDWNAEIENSTEVFDSCDAINAYIQGVFIPTFLFAANEMDRRQASHCPDFAGESTHGSSVCGERVYTGMRFCN